MFQLSSWVRLFVFSLLGLLLTVSRAQNNLSGVINAYTPVTSTANIGNNALSVASVADFSIGDLVLIIQMQGASINTTNTSSFGNVTAYNGAGHYELATICNIDGNELTFEHSLVYTDYQVAGRVQVIRVPEYSRATVSGTLTAPAWNGSTGGVLVLSVAGTLRLDAPIDLNGKGFRGAAYENSNNNTCNFLTNRADYAYNTPDLGALKGEGIAPMIASQEYGRGAQANGGGGGNDHNAGGGGGGNGASGGQGGENDEPGTFNCKGRNPGVGGKAPALIGRIFMGGGGGAGQGNNVIPNNEGPGANGGGIFILLADTLEVGLSGLISANGDNAPASMSDGAGGGGAGGSLHLEVNTYAGTPLLQVRGGNGGNTDNEFLNRCFGPGGGGSGGLLRTQPALPGSITPALTGGAPGVVTRTANNGCTGSTNGAAGGSAGLIQTAAVPRSLTPDPACLPLPLQWVELYLRDPELHWITAREPEGSWFVVESSTDARNWTGMGEVLGKGDPFRMQRYSFPVTSQGSITYFRLQHRDASGGIAFSPVVSLQGQPVFDVTLSPNPIRMGEVLQLQLSLPAEGEVDLSLMDARGRAVKRMYQQLPAGRSSFSMPLAEEMAAGIYLLRLEFQGREQRFRIVVVQ